MAYCNSFPVINNGAENYEYHLREKLCVCVCVCSPSLFPGPSCDVFCVSFLFHHHPLVAHCRHPIPNAVHWQMLSEINSLPPKMPINCSFSRFVEDTFGLKLNPEFVTEVTYIATRLVYVGASEFPCKSALLVLVTSHK